MLKSLGEGLSVSVCVCAFHRGIVHMLHCGSMILMPVSFTLEKKMGTDRNEKDRKRHIYWGNMRQ